MAKRPGGEMATRPLHFIWIVDCSGSMDQDGKIQTLNNAIKDAIPLMRKVADENPNAEVLVRALAFSSGAQWHVSKPTPIGSFNWNALTADGVTDMGRAFTMLAEQLKIPPMPDRTHLARVVKADLDAARETWLKTAPDAEATREMRASDFLAYKSGDGRFADFHAFRHVTGSFLARAGVNPKLAQAILRHSDYRLTMNVYSHAYRQDEAEAVERLPDLARRTKAAAAGTGGQTPQNPA